MFLGIRQYIKEKLLHFATLIKKYKMEKILLALMSMLSVVGHTQTDISIEVDDTTDEHPDL